MKTILVTGDGGQLSSEIKNLAKQYQMFDITFADEKVLDISDKANIDSFFAKNKFDAIVNCAAYTAVDDAEKDYKIARKVNVDGVKNLNEVCKKLEAYFIHVSTDYVFDGSKNRPYKETDITNPKSVYGQTKLDGERVIDFTKDKSIVIRTSWLYSTFGKNFLLTMLNLANERDAVKVVFDQVGTPTYASDLADTILTILHKTSAAPNTFKSGIYHYSNEGVCSWYDFAQAIFNFVGFLCEVEPIESAQFPTPAPRPAYSVLNKRKIKETFKIKIPHWIDALERCLNKLYTDTGDLPK